jgi:hypothetical protein
LISAAFTGNGNQSFGLGEVDVPLSPVDGSFSTFIRLPLTTWPGSYTVGARACGGAAASFTFTVTGRMALSTSTVVANPSGFGYWIRYGGAVTPFGNAAVLNDLSCCTMLNGAVVGMAATPSGRGYWMVGTDGGLFNFGDAGFLGGLGGLHLNAPIVGIAATPSGRGYWMVGADGGVFNFGDAPFLGSLGAIHLNAPIVGIAATPSGRGYWMVGADGGVFNFGDAPFLGSLGAIHLNRPATAITSTRTGRGYWIAGADGGVFTFGDAPFLGAF